MGMLILLSLFGLGMFAGLMDSDDTEQETTEPDPSDLTPPEPPTLGGTVFDITESAGQIDDGSRTAGGAYRVTDSYYNVTAGSGDDTIVVEGDNFGRAYLGDGDDAVWGGEGRDILYGQEGNDSLFGGDGNDTLYDTEGENSLYGGDGDDFIRASSGSTVVGGDGADTFRLYLFDDAESPLRLLDYDPEMDESLEIRLHVSNGGVYDLTAVAREDENGTDLMFGGRVLAEIYGASVDDLVDVPVSIEVNGGSFTDDDAGHRIRSEYFLPETILGAGGDDTINGGPGDMVDAGDGNDVVFANGQFTLDVPDPLDTSTIVGGSGDDTILSSNGNVLTGGDGADTFGVSASQYNSAGTGSSFDLTESIITDFDPAQDVIYIEGGFIIQAGGTFDDIAASVSIQVWSNGEGADIVAGDEIIVRVSGGQTLRVEDLMIAENGLETDLLGYH